MFAIEDKEQEKQYEEETVKQIAIAVEAVTKATKRWREKARPEARIQAKKYDLAYRLSEIALWPNKKMEKEGRTLLLFI